MFQDRMEAGYELAEALQEYKDKKDVVVIALPRGGVVTGYAIAQALHLPLEVAMVKKLGHPFNPEYAIGAVSLNDRIMDRLEGVNPEYIEDATEEIRKVLKARFEQYHGDEPRQSVKNKTVILVDDGVATGKTLTIAIRLLRKEAPKAIIAAVPVGPTDTMDHLQSLVDRLICLEAYEDFYAIGSYYQHFKQVTDEEVVELLHTQAKVMET